VYSVREDMKSLGLSQEDAKARAQWRMAWTMKIKVGNPLNKFSRKLAIKKVCVYPEMRK